MEAGPGHAGRGLGYPHHVADQHLEREIKFDVPPDYAVPDMAGARRRTFHLRATYYDTDDALLQGHGLSLRRRVGGTDDAWHLKIPRSGGKLELHADVASSRPPRQFAALTRGLRYDQALHRTAVIRTERELQQLFDAEGELVAEVADDRVSTTIVATDEVVCWREIEVELGAAGDAETIERVVRKLETTGAVPSTEPSKYAHAVGQPQSAPVTGLGGLVGDYLLIQLDRLAWEDFRLRQGENRVHKARVAVRRIRSTLRTCAELFEETRRAELDDHLTWYADVLGAVRDLDVCRHHLDEDLLTEPSTGSGGLIDTSAADRLLGELDSRREAAWQQIERVLAGRRYGALLATLGEWRRGVPWTDPALGDADEVETYLRRARKKADHRRKRAENADRDQADEAFHRARKAAKRTRYTAELATPHLGKGAKKIAKTYEKRQDDLGVVQDHRMVIAMLRTVAGSRAVRPEVAFLCGLLAQRHLEAKRRELTGLSSG
jgi:CHAD domain-containing protein